MSYHPVAATSSSSRPASSAGGAATPPPKPPRRSATASPATDATAAPIHPPLPPKSAKPVSMTLKPAGSLPAKPISMVARPSASAPAKPAASASTEPVASSSAKPVSMSVSPARPPPPTSTRPAIHSAPSPSPSDDPSTASTEANSESRTSTPARFSSIQIFSSIAIPSISLRRNSSMARTPIEEILLQGVLHKRKRDGAFEKCSFILTKLAVKYCKLSLNSNADEVLEESNYRSLPLDSLVITSLEEGEYDCAKRERAFRLMSKVKSFLLRAKTVELCEEWIEALSTAAAARRIVLQLAQPSTSELAPVWLPAEVNHCQLCLKGFGMFQRPQHCRNCGICVCEGCSTEKVRLFKLDPRALFKVCNPCASSIKNNRTYGANTPS